LKARLQTRRGAPCWQPYLELRKLFAKEVVVSEHASWLFRAAPFVVFASAVAVSFLVPILAVPLPFDTVGDLIVVVYLLLLGTFFLALAGLDPGSAFGGMGASREMTVAALAEPTIALAIFALALSAGSTNLGRGGRADAGRPRGGGRDAAPQARRAGGRGRGLRNTRGQAPPVSRPRAPERVLRPRPPGHHLLLPLALMGSDLDFHTVAAPG